MSNMKAQKKERRPRRTFTPEFKAEVIAFCRQPGHGPALAAKDFDLTESAVRAWLRQDDIDNGRSSSALPSRKSIPESVCRLW
jgi:transposase